MHTSHNLKIDNSWTLLLDRDGVINVRVADDYVRRPEQLSFIEGSLEALAILHPLFSHCIITSNQQGVGKELFFMDDLIDIDRHLRKKISDAGGHIDGSYYCTHLAGDHCSCRKPETGLGEQAQADYPEIDFAKTIMVGDSASDMEFGRRLGCITVLLGQVGEKTTSDYSFGSLKEFAVSLINVQ